MTMRFGFAAVLVLGVAGCATDVATVQHSSFAYNGRNVEITRETFTLANAGPQVRYFVESNFVRYPCDGSVPDCRKIYERAETFPRERGRDEPEIWIRPR
jgi:hypothetical protein